MTKTLLKPNLYCPEEYTVHCTSMNSQLPTYFPPSILQYTREFCKSILIIGFSSGRKLAMYNLLARVCQPTMSRQLSYCFSLIQGHKFVLIVSPSDQDLSEIRTAIIEMAIADNYGCLKLTPTLLLSALNWKAPQIQKAEREEHVIVFKFSAMFSLLTRGSLKNKFKLGFLMKEFQMAQSRHLQV